MPITLREALLEAYQGWEEALPDAWRSTLGDVTLDGSGVDEGLLLRPWVPIFPTLASSPAHRILGAPWEAHVFGAFRQIRPRDVRAVIVGQDPYPDVAKATGVSFAQGNIKDWLKDAHLVSKSLRRIIQAAAAADNEDKLYLGSGGWIRFLDGIQSGLIRPRSPGEFFQETRAQGVLWLNTTLSISYFRGHDAHDHQPGHRAFWAPLVDTLMEYLASRAHPCVYVLWGGWARDLKPGLEAAAERAGTRDTVGFTEAGHPATVRFLNADPLTSVNDELERFGLDPIDWL